MTARAKTLVALVLYAVLLAVVAACLAPRATANVDENVYLEMARLPWTRALEIPNGVELVDSSELWLGNTIKRGAHLYAKYPPLYALLARPAYRLFGLRGLAGLNAAALALIVVAFFLLAERVVSRRLALAAALALPLCSGLLHYGLLIMPHALAAAALLWAIKLGQDAVDATSPRRSVCLGALAGLAIGLAIGIRLQNLLGGLLLLAAARSRRAAILGMCATGALCLAVMAWINQARFGSLNPLSYGPPGHLGSPAEVETLRHFVTAPAYYQLAAVVAFLVAALHWSRDVAHRWRAWGVLSALALAVLLGVPTLRGLVLDLLRGLAVLLVDSSLIMRGWLEPLQLHGWIRKSLLQEAPLLVLGLAGAVLYLRSGPRALTTAARISLATILFIALRPLHVATEQSALGMYWLGPRYLVEVTPLLALLACHVVQRARLTLPWLSGGAIVGLALGATIWIGGAGAASPLKRGVVLYLSLALAAAALLALRRRALLTAIVAAASVYAACVAVGDQLRAVRSFAGGHARWVCSLAEVLPPRSVLVGWSGAMHGPYAVRERRDVIMVDASIDRAADLHRVLAALTRDGRAAYYFGLQLDQVSPRLPGWRARPILTDPLLWRLEPVPRPRDRPPD